VHLVLLEFDLGAEQVDDRAAVRSDDRETLARRAPTRDLGELAPDEASRDEAERASSDERVHECARLSVEGGGGKIKKVQLEGQLEYACMCVCVCVCVCTYILQKPSLSNSTLHARLSTIHCPGLSILSSSSGGKEGKNGSEDTEAVMTSNKINEGMNLLHFLKTFHLFVMILSLCFEYFPPSYPSSYFQVFLLPCS